MIFLISSGKPGTGSVSWLHVLKVRVCVYFPDRCRGPNGQARAEESPHCPADGQAQVQEASAEAPRVRQPLRRHRDEGAGGL